MKKFFTWYRNELASLPAFLKILATGLSLPLVWIGWVGLSSGSFSGFTKSGVFVRVGGIWGLALSITLLLAGLLIPLLLVLGPKKSK